MIENELKLRVCREHFYAVVNAYYIEAKRELLNVYYDTADHIFYSHNHTYRIRYEKGSKYYPKSQLKLSQDRPTDGRFVRKEYELRHPSFVPPRVIYLIVRNPFCDNYNAESYYDPLGRKHDVDKAAIYTIQQARKNAKPADARLFRLGSARTTRYNLKTRAGILEADRVDLPNGQTYFELEYEGNDIPELMQSLRYELPEQRLISAKTLGSQDLEQAQRRRQRMATYSVGSKYQVFVQQCILYD